MKKQISILAGIILMMVSCSHHTYTVDTMDSGGSRSVAFGYSSKDRVQKKTKDEKVTNSIRVPSRLTGGDANLPIPEATAFRMSGDYANNVAVTLSNEGELIYFPAPTDITADSEPIELGDGWWLNNQGLGPNSVFTKYTFAEYAALPVSPSPQQIKQSIISGAKVTDFLELPFKIGETQNNLEAIKLYIQNRD